MKGLPIACACLFLASLVASASVQEDRAALLQGVDEIVVAGGIPGDFAVFGDQAFVVIAARMGGAQLPMVAAARYGKGRAVAAGHEGFFSGANLQHPANGRLVTNIAAWVSNKPAQGLRVGLIGQDPALAVVLAASGCRTTVVAVEDLPGRLGDVDEVWLNQASLDGPANRVRVTAIGNWVHSGGGVVVSGPGWGWQQVHPDLELANDQSGNRLLIPMGIAFAGGMLEPTGTGSFVAGIGVNGIAHAGEALKALEAHAAGARTLAPADLTQVTTVLGQAVGALPATGNAFVKRVAAACAERGGDVLPTRQTPITTAMPFARLSATLFSQQWRRLPPDQVGAYPSATSFPGVVSADAPRETRSVAIDTRVPDWHGVGLYAAPGEVVTVTVPAEAVRKGLAVRIGAHTDTLWHLDRWERFPEVTIARPLDAASTRIASPFGGTLYIVVPERCRLGSVQFTIAHAVAAPRYVRGATALRDWRETLRLAPGPWAELEGKLVILTVPSTAVRDLDDPEALMAYWDEVMKRCYELYAAPKRSRPERYCVDRQISAGYMHSGYPIMTGDDVAKTFCDVTVLRARNAPIWGFYHEMGHNFQQPEWTWQEWGETTNNLFSMYGADKINSTPVGAHPAMSVAQIEERMRTVAAAPGKERYYARDPWYPLTMLDLVREEFGWTPFTKLFAEFRDLPGTERPRSEAEKHDQFLARFSKLLGRNLTVYLDAWGVETSQAARFAVKDLSTWMPKGWPKP